MITIILGTKAQLIKMAPVMKCLEQRGIIFRFVHTGQHRETMEEMYRDFGIKQPDLILYEGADIVSVKQIVIWFVRLICMAIFQKSRIFGKTGKGIVLVHGDTLSTLLGALMGRVAGLKVGHVESGLRSFNYFHPFPEEITRVLVFRLSHILFCPGQWAVDNVLSLKKQIVNTRMNTLINTIEMSRSVKGGLRKIPEKPFSIVSLHRYENIFKKEQLTIIIELLEDIAKKNYMLFVLHPPTESQLKRNELYTRLQKNNNIECVPRMQHSDFLNFLQQAEFVVTDGGSLQEESAYLGIPCLLLREATERREGLGENVILSRFNKETISDFISSYKQLRHASQNYNTSPSMIIVDSIEAYCQEEYDS